MSNKIALINFIILLFFYSEGDAQWIKLKGPAAGNVLSIQGAHDRIFAGTFQGLFCSSDNGNQWNVSNRGVSNPGNIYSIITIAETTFIGTSLAGVYRTTDQGGTWTTVNNGLDCPAILSFIYIDNYFFCGTSGSGIYRSTNYGQTWIKKSKGLTDPYIFALEIVGNELFAGTGAGVFRSTDMGETWFSLNDGFPIIPNYDYVIYSLLNAGTMLLAGTKDGLYLKKQTDLKWKVIGKSPEWNRVNDLLFADGILYAAVLGRGIFKSSDSGSSWILFNTGLPSINVTSIYKKDSTLLLGTLASGIYRFDYHHSRWCPASNGLGMQKITRLACNEQTLFAGTVSSGVLYSMDEGNTWMTPDSGMVDVVVASLTVGKKQVYAGSYNQGLYVSTDDGKGWSSIKSGLTRSTIYGLCLDDNYLYAGLEYAGVYRMSFDLPIWQEINSGLPIEKNVQSLSISQGKLYVGFYNGRSLYFSTNSGSSWNWSGLTLPGYSTIYAVLATSKYTFASTGHFGIYAAVNGNTTWNAVNSGIPDNCILSMASFNETIYAGSQGHGVLMSTNNGISWQKFNQGLFDSVGIQTLITKGSNLFLGTEYGIWKRQLVAATSTEDSYSLRIDSFSLLQNHPNPFNPSTTIRYALPHQTKVKLSIYDILGREVAILADEQQDAGWKNVQWDASGFPSGIYFYRLQAGGYVSTKKLILLR